MRAVMNGVRAALALGLVTAAHTTACAQGPGSTVQGDILSGEGQFLRGRGIYELYSARGAADRRPDGDDGPAMERRGLRGPPA